MFNRSWIARYKPLRLKLTFEDVNENKSYQIIEYVNPLPTIREASDQDKLNIYVDNPEMMCRENFYIRDEDLENDKVFNLNGTTYSVDEVNKIVYKAIKEDKYEYLLVSKKVEEFEWEAFGLIDSGCKRMYGIKVLLQNKFAATMGYYTLPLYKSSKENGDSKVGLTEMIGIPARDKISVDDEDVDHEKGEDGLGDLKSNSSKGGEVNVSGNNANMNGGLEGIIPLLNSLDNKMDRIAGSLEKLVAILELSIKK